MKVDEQVGRWIDVIVRLGTAHTAAEADAAEFDLDEIMEPVLAAPVSQLRAFYSKLVEGMKEHPGVPYIIWRSFEQWRDSILEQAPDQEVMKLQNELAESIAAGVEQEVQPDIVDALTNALKWRPAADLEKVKRNLDEGEKPRVRGRQSCLFLEVGDARVML